MAERGGSRRGLRAGLGRAATEEKINLITDHVIRENSLTTLMLTHSMEQALEQGARTLMVHRGEIFADLAGASARGSIPTIVFAASRSSDIP
jgi:ABC-type uncharacterized transport system ATPase component